jgi:hypothetical protein
MRPRRAAFAAAVIAVVACHKNIARPPVEEVPIRDPSETAPPTASNAVAKSNGKPPKSTEPDPAAPPTPVVPASAAPAATQADAPDPPRDKAFPKTVDACKKDEDCAATNLALGGEFLCCTPCKPVAGTKGWVKRVEQVCAQKARSGWKPRCAPSDCARPEAECKSGKCVVK